MRISADRERCIGAGMCALIAPDIFDQDEDDGRVRVLQTGPEHAETAREAVAACPSGALTLTN